MNASIFNPPPSPLDDMSDPNDESGQMQVTRHTSHVTRHTSHVTGQDSLSLAQWLSLSEFYTWPHVKPQTPNPKPQTPNPKP